MADETSLQHAVEVLKAGGAVIFPTDTVFGLGVSVGHAPSPRLLYDLKRRDASKPIAWLVGSPADLDVYGADVPDLARQLADRHWPGPLTVVVRASRRVPAAFASAQGTIGLRMPNDPVALELIGRVGFPLATTSANASGMPAAGSAAQIDPALAAAVGCVVEGGLSASGVASTIVDCTGPEPRILRQG
ncbi:MAG: L-threonylcarbamoyladenylate synthase [Eggerthellales bacterium]|nr:L-threonylcarbamoyladenylate synthase [Eggerthellales bacterium]